MNSRIRLTAILISTLLLAGLGLQRSLPSVPVRETGQGLPAAGAPRANRRNLSGAVLGGLRALVADGLWMRTYVAWTAHDGPATEALIRLVTLVDDRPLGFWLNGARMLAYDMTEWRLDAAAAGGPPAAGVRRAIEADQAGRALRYLEDARRRHPDSAEVCVEIANINLNLRRDPVAAAEWYRRAAETPNAPYYAARVHGELLCRIGRPRAAYDWLCRLHPRLPPDDQDAMAEVVLIRIRRLEQVLAVPPSARYLAPGRVASGREN